MNRHLLTAVLCALTSTALAQEPPPKPPASAGMFESTRPPATDEESAAVLAELETQLSTAPALFVRGYLVDRRGMTLYTFERDRPGVSTCYRACERLWPPLMADLDAVPYGEFDLHDRMDGSRQWNWRGQPSISGPRTNARATSPATTSAASGIWCRTRACRVSPRPPSRLVFQRSLNTATK